MNSPSSAIAWPTSECPTNDEKHSPTMNHASLLSLQTAVKNALNLSFPSVLRSRSWDGFEYLHQGARYERWYNAELVMHLGHEIQWTQFDTNDTNCVHVWGEAEAVVRGTSTKKRRPDWVIVEAEVEDHVYRPFQPREVLVAGETKIIALGDAGEGPNAEPNNLHDLAKQLNAAQLRESIRIAFLVLPCWARKGKQECIDDAVRDAVKGFLSGTIHKAFGLELKINDLQVITGSFQSWSPEQVTKFALLQCVMICVPGAKEWKVVAPPYQHQLWIADERPSNREREAASVRA